MYVGVCHQILHQVTGSGPCKYNYLKQCLSKYEDKQEKYITNQTKTFQPEILTKAVNEKVQCL